MSKNKEGSADHESIIGFIEHRQQQRLIRSIEYLKNRDRRERQNDSRPISYDPSTRILVIQGQRFDFSSSRHAQGVLSMLFADRANLTTHINNTKYLYLYANLLSDHDIYRDDQIRAAKRFIQSKVLLKDLFPHKGSLVINSKYL